MILYSFPDHALRVGQIKLDSIFTQLSIFITSKWRKQSRDVIGDGILLLVRVRVGAAVDRVRTSARAVDQPTSVVHQPV